MDRFSADHFNNDDAARAYLESVMWPDGPVCPHCGVVNHAYATKRKGVYRCAEAACRKDFTVTMKTVMERSKIALHKWLQAFHLMCSSKKGISAHQLHRTLDIGYEAAWFMCHRIREAMREGGLKPLGGKGQVVEADETYFGQVEERKPSAQRKGRPYTKGGRSGPGGKRAVVSLVERGGRVRSFHPASADANSVVGIVLDNIDRETRLHTDESRLYTFVGTQFAAHETVTHSHKEYVRGDVHNYLVKTNDGAFDQDHDPGVYAPLAGIYRCMGCHREIGIAQGHVLPPQSDHTHTPAQGRIRWRLIVWADHNPKN